MTDDRDQDQSEAETPVDPGGETTDPSGSDEHLLDELRTIWKQDGHGELPHIPGYSIERELNRGGQGVVYDAMQTATHRRVALKMLLQGAHSSERQRIRFEREAELVAALKHPDIVAVWDSGVSDTGAPWIAMEFIDGQPLHTWLKAQNAEAPGLERRVVVALVARIARAVTAAHRRGIIHRDLKPANILIDESGTPHILDFGLAKPVNAEDWSDSSAVTAAGEFMGTFAYAAPEQVSGDPDAVDARTDVWALGVILYEALLGQPPLQLEGSLSDIVNAIQQADVVAPSLVDPTLDRDLETILLRALDGDPDRRTAGPGDLARDLQHWLDGEPIEARRDETWYVAGKLLRRHWLAVSGIAASMLVLLTFSITMWVMYEQATDANNRLRGTLGMTWDVLATADAENPNQALAAADLGDMMQRWSHILNTELQEYPEITAQMQIAVGRTLLGRGRLDEAAAALQAAKALINVDIQEPSLLAAELLHEEGRVYYKRGLYAQAAEAYAQALSHRQVLLGDHANTATSLHHLGASMHHGLSPEEGTAAMQQAIDMRRDLLATAADDATRHTLQLSIVNGLNSIAVGYSIHAPELALPMLREGLAIMLAEGADGHRDWRVGSLRHNIGACLTSLDQLEDAQSELEQALTIKELQGNEVQIANTQFELARLALRQGQPAAGDVLLAAAHAVQRDALPLDHPACIRSSLLAIDLTLAMGDVSQAQSLLDQGRSLPRLDINERLGMLAAARNAHDAADHRLQQVHAARVEAHGPTSPSTRRVARHLEVLWRNVSPKKANHWQQASQAPAVQP